MYKGDTRPRTVDVSVDGSLVTTWTSSGTTTDFEGVPLSGAYGQVVTITGSELADRQWLSIVEVGGPTPSLLPFSPLMNTRAQASKKANGCARLKLRPGGVARRFVLRVLYPLRVPQNVGLYDVGFRGGLSVACTSVAWRAFNLCTA